MITSSHYTIKKVLLLLTKESRKLIHSLEENPDQYNFEEKMNTLNYIESVQKLLIGDEESTPSQEAWEQGMKIIQELESLGHIKTKQFPIFVDMKVGKESEEHIQAHEKHDTVLSSQVGSLEELEQEVEIKPRKNGKTKQKSLDRSKG